MRTQSIYQSKTSLLSITLLAVLFSFVFIPIQRAEAMTQSSDYRDCLKLAEEKEKICIAKLNSTNTASSDSQSTSGAPSESLQSRLTAALRQIAELQARMTALNLGTAPKVGTDSSCPAFTHPLSEGSTDATTNGEVTRLQKHLAQDPTLYPEAQVTGYFGPATERAVQRFQAKHGIANSGTPETTGYGSVGGQTRIKLGAMCTSTTVLKTEDTKTKTTTTPVAKVKRALSGSTYGLDDVESITYQVWGKPVPGHGYAVLGKAFTITLVDGTTRKVFDNGLAGTIQSATNFKLTASEYSKSKFGGIGYSGDVDALLAKAVKLSGVDTTDSKGKLPSTSG